jgi:hypothetical protein
MDAQPIDALVVLFTKQELANGRINKIKLNIMHAIGSDKFVACKKPTDTFVDVTLPTSSSSSRNLDMYFLLDPHETPDYILALLYLFHDKISKFFEQSQFISCGRLVLDFGFLADASLGKSLFALSVDQLFFQVMSYFPGFETLTIDSLTLGEGSLSLALTGSTQNVFFIRSSVPTIGLTLNNSSYSPLNVYVDRQLPYKISKVMVTLPSPSATHKVSLTKTRFLDQEYVPIPAEDNELMEGNRMGKVITFTLEKSSKTTQGGCFSCCCDC